MEQNIKQLKLFIVDLVCVTINDMKEDIKELKSREKLNVILKLLPYVCDNNEVKRSLKQFILNMRNRKKNAKTAKYGSETARNNKECNPKHKGHKGSEC